MKELKFVNKSPNANPQYAKEGDSGFDLRAWVDGDDEIILKPLERKMIHTGIYLDIPENCEVQVRPRSGCAIKQGLTIINTPGSVDESYTGEICVLAINLSNEDIRICNGDRIAQAVLMPVYNSKQVNLTEVEEITKETDRGDGGFGHTGVK